MNYIQDLWDDCQEQCLSPDMSRERVETCRRLFYAGAAAMFLVINAKMKDPTITEEMGQAFVNDLSQEIDDYMHELDRQSM